MLDPARHRATLKITGVDQMVAVHPNLPVVALSLLRPPLTSQ
jgi:hypothetical protein